MDRMQQGNKTTHQAQPQAMPEDTGVGAGATPLYVVAWRFAVMIPRITSTVLTVFAWR